MCQLFSQLNQLLVQGQGILGQLLRPQAQELTLHTYKQSAISALCELKAG